MVKVFCRIICSFVPERWKEFFYILCHKTVRVKTVFNQINKPLVLIPNLGFRINSNSNGH